MKPPVRSMVGNLVWSTDGGVWAVWRVRPFAHAHSSVADKLSVHAQLRGLLLTLPAESMLLSICQRISPYQVVDRMVDGVDLDERPVWDAVCAVTTEWLGAVPLRRRRYYVAVALEEAKAPWKRVLRDALGDVGTSFGLAPFGVPGDEVVKAQRQAMTLQLRLAQHASVSTVTAGELCWLYSRSLRREIDEPWLDELWEPPVMPEDVEHQADREAVEARRPRGVLAHLTDVLVKEGGFADDQDRQRHRRYVRVDHPAGTAYQTVLALADMPHYFRYPGGGGEWLFHVDRVEFPVDWCVRIRAVPNADAQGKVRRKHRDLIGQVEEYDGEVTGAPPQLSEAIRSIDTERNELGANPAEPELQVTVLMSVAAGNLAELEDRAAALQTMFQPEEYGLARPTGGQAALLRSMLPGTQPAAVCRDYTQFMLTRDLAAGAPYCGVEVGDPKGLLLGVSLDGGTGGPVLFDPAYGPQVNASPSLAAVGRLGSGKSFFLKRLCWDTVARGGQVVTIDRTHSGEYARLASSMGGRVQVVRLEAGADARLDPLRSFGGDQRHSVTLGFLSLLAGSSAYTEEGAALAEAIDVVAEDPDARLVDVVTRLEQMGSDRKHPDAAARGLARRLAHYARSPTGQLAFGEGEALALDADFIIFWAPNLALADRETIASDEASRLMLPEQVMGQALLYLVAAVGRQVVFRDPSRFAAALYDEAWALLASPHGQNLLIEGVRDGRKHNGAIWLASQHPNDFAISELSDLLGSKFVFRQARQAIDASLRFLGADDSRAAAATLDQGLDTGVCLYRDVRDRIGLIQVLPPALPELDEVFNTAPTAPGPEVELEGGGAADAIDVELVSATRDELEAAAVAELGAGSDGVPEAEVGDEAGADDAAGGGSFDDGPRRRDDLPGNGDAVEPDADESEVATMSHEDTEAEIEDRAEPVSNRVEEAADVGEPHQAVEPESSRTEGNGPRSRVLRRSRGTPLAKALAERDES